MDSYTLPSMFIAYGFFFVAVVGGIYFFVRSFKDGYWNNHSEDAKYRMLEDDEEELKHAR